jgi:D-lactate dehydrogenase
LIKESKIERKNMLNLLQPDVERIMPAEHKPTHDHAPEGLALGTPVWLRDDLIELLGKDQVHSRLIDLIKYATDASPYRMFPKVVVSPRTVGEVSKIFAYARTKKLPVTIRAAGSSLSGQAQGDGILIDARKHWVGATVEDGGRRLRVRPGTVMFRANLALQPHGYRLGPDPASSGVATVGGVIANNASGMCCGTVENSYKTLESISFLLPSGTFINTADPDAETQFNIAEPELAAGLLQIKQEIEKDAQLVERLKKKFSIKNTTGYHMGAFLDEATPLGIFRKLLVGSEGTLAFISEGVFETVPDDKFRLTTFLIFPDMRSACAAVAPFIAHGAAAVELSDRGCLRAVEGKPGVPDRWKVLPEKATALLVEFREPSVQKLEASGKAAQSVLDGLQLLEKAEFTQDPILAAQYWTIRSGLLPSIGGARPSGSSLILEDVCFPPDKLADGALDLQALFPKHGYHGVVFGHASAGNLHFLITPSLNTEADVQRFDGFLKDVVKLIVDKYDGSLKAEHGTGRNIAPFVEHEWGLKLTEMMWRIKRLADPDHILAPDVMLTRDAKAHLRHLHTVPTVEAEVDRCIECGYCEPVCPSRHITTTPRQRIVLRREMLRQPLGSAVTETLLRQYEYDAVETCAGDGSCALACPVGINTGLLMKQFRHEEHNRTEEFVAEKIAENWGMAEVGARAALRLNHLATSIFGGSLIAEGALKAARSVVSKDLMPGWLPNIPPAASVKVPRTSREGAAAVYFHACVNRMFGGTDGQEQPPLADAMVAVSARAGKPVWIPGDLSGTCCATVWHSKGYADGNKYMANKIVEKMWEWSDHGKLPIVCDASSCTFGIASEIKSYLTLENAERHRQLTIMDSVAWAYDHLLPNLNVTRRVSSAAIHPVCSIHHLGLVEKLRKLGQALAEQAVTPIYATCCAFAGDRGFLHPELTRSATSEEVQELNGHEYTRYLCSNRTCELGMNLATGKDYQSVVFLLEELTRDPGQQDSPAQK